MLGRARTCPQPPTTQGRLEIHRRHSVAKSRSIAKNQPVRTDGALRVISRVLWLSGAVEKGLVRHPERRVRARACAVRWTFDSSLRSHCFAEQAASWANNSAVRLQGNRHRRPRRLQPQAGTRVRHHPGHDAVHEVDAAEGNPPQLSAASSAAASSKVDWRAFAHVGSNVVRVDHVMARSIGSS